MSALDLSKPTSLAYHKTPDSPPASVTPPPRSPQETMTNPMTTNHSSALHAHVQAALKAIEDFDTNGHALEYYNYILPDEDKPQDLKKVTNFSILQDCPISRAAAASLQHAASQKQSLLLQLLGARYLSSDHPLFKVDPTSSESSGKTLIGGSQSDEETSTPRESARHIAQISLRDVKEKTISYGDAFEDKSIQTNDLTPEGVMKVHVLKTAINAAIQAYSSHELSPKESRAYERQLLHYLVKATLRPTDSETGKTAQTFANLQPWVTLDAYMASHDDQYLPLENKKTLEALWLEFCNTYNDTMTKQGNNDKNVIESVKAMTKNVQADGIWGEEGIDPAHLKKFVNTVKKEEARRGGE